MLIKDPKTGEITGNCLLFPEEKNANRSQSPRKSVDTNKRPQVRILTDEESIAYDKRMGL